MPDVMVIAAHDSHAPGSGVDVQCTGENDSLRIQAAIDACQAMPYPPRLEPLAGTYLLKEPLWIGYNFQDFKGNPYEPRLDPDSPGCRAFAPNFTNPSGRATFEWVGPPTDDYMISYAPKAGAAAGLATRFIENLLLFGNNKARGLFIGSACYGFRLERAIAYCTRGVGIDIIDSWGMEARNCLVIDATGYAVRINGGGGGTCLDLAVQGCKAGDWPTDRPEIPHAMVALIASGNAFIGTQLEDNNKPGYDEVPLLWLNATGTGLHHVRIEKCQSLHPIVVEKSQACIIEGVSAVMSPDLPEHLIEFRGSDHCKVGQVAVGRIWKDGVGWIKSVTGSIVSGAKGNAVSGVVFT
jgi:hypothetical protein